MAIEIVAQSRKSQGSGAARRSRRAGFVPAVVYGGRRDPVTIELEHNAIFQALRHERFHASVLSLKVDGSEEQVLLRAFNMHPWRPIVQHVDFQRVRSDEPIHMKVPLHFINTEISPAVKTSAAVVSHVMNDVDIRCLPDKLPEYITVDLNELTAGSSVHLRDIVFPEGVEPMLNPRENPVVVTAQVPRAAAEEEKTETATPVAAVPAAKQPDKPEAAKPAADKGGDKGAKGGKK